MDGLMFNPSVSRGYGFASRLKAFVITENDDIISNGCDMAFIRRDVLFGLDH